MAGRYTISEIRLYLLSQDSFGDALYNLSEDNIEKAIADYENSPDEEGEE